MRRRRAIAISLKLTLNKSDWDSRVGGWKCEPLSLPGAKLAQVCFSGRDAVPPEYSLKDTIIIWNRSEKPSEITAIVQLEKDLSRIDVEKSGLEQVKTDLESEKLELEREKFKSDKRWKLLSALGAVAAALLTFATSHFFNVSDDHGKEVERIYVKSNDFLSSRGSNTFLQLLKNTQREGWFVGTSFYISVDGYRDEILDKARSGVNLYFLILNPASQGLSRTALAADLSEETVREQCVTGIRSLKSLETHFNLQGRLVACMCDYHPKRSPLGSIFSIRGIQME
jgi:hypothetical protein